MRLARFPTHLVGLRLLRFSCRSSKSSEFTSRTQKIRSSSTFMEVVKQAFEHAAEHPDRAAIRADKKSYTFAQLVASALDVSAVLRNKVKESSRDEDKIPLGSSGSMGFLNGTRVGIVAKPSPEFVAGLYGTWLSGGVAVPLALSYPEAEILHVVNDSDISVILSTQEHQELMEKVSVKCSVDLSPLPVVSSMCSETDACKHDANGLSTQIAVLMPQINNAKLANEDSPALILYTSGTTGKPKGVVHTRKSITSQVEILIEAWEYASGDQFLHCLPLHHVHGLFNALLAPLHAGSLVEFMPKFSVRGVWQRWRESYPKDDKKSEDCITVFTGVPTMYVRLLQGYEAMDDDLKLSSASAAKQLRLMMCGSSALPYPVMKQWEDITGHRLLERYGMTEFVMAIANPLHGKRKGGTVGKPLPRVEVKIMMEDDTESTTGVGELCVRSPSLFKEYWKLPKITAESFIDGGFFKTGDTVTMDEDGYFVILGRTNADIMKVGGYKLSALEIEAVLLENEAISECSVLGLRDKDYGEIVCAIVVAKEGAKRTAEQELKPPISLEELRLWAKDKLAPYKIPTKMLLWDSLPRNAMGKVNKKELKKMLEERA